MSKQLTQNITQRLGYSPDEAAIVAGVGRTTIYEEIKAGRLEARKLGARTIITHEALQAWLASLPTRTSVAA